ncbi:uncharacterized protein [Nicotiana tomentosiformis]|uniref:uncharacterized protein n=1 Tax=Nicotiana tomentosiformis TaxID=4098 RepID=UPI00388C36A7
MLEKETARLEDSLTAMTRIIKENEEIDRKNKIEKIRQQAKKELQQVEENKNTRIMELEKELAILKELYENKQREREKKKELEQEERLKEEIKKFREKLIEDIEVKLEEINETNNENEQNTESSEDSEISETYTELITKTNNVINPEIYAGDISEKPRHLAKDCKLPRDPKKKQITEINTDNEEYMQLDYIDYELDSEDSIYELEPELETEIESEKELSDIEEND